MATSHGQMECKLYPSAFSGEVVFQVDTIDKQSYEGVAPKHYIKPGIQLSKDGVTGLIRVQILSNSANKAWVRLPDGEVIAVLANKVYIDNPDKPTRGHDWDLDYKCAFDI